MLSELYKMSSRKREINPLTVTIYVWGCSYHFIERVEHSFNPKCYTRSVYSLGTRRNKIQTQPSNSFAEANYYRETMRNLNYSSLAKSFRLPQKVLLCI